jgi:SAM-dependent methyltransferase
MLIIFISIHRKITSTLKTIIFGAMKKENVSKDWFATWFDSPYYHLLYNNRDEHEASLFFEQLIQELAIPAGTKVLDLACGAGRHARAMAKIGLRVSACDLSANSIAEAIEHSDPSIRFFVHDMRQPLDDTYQCVFNLFTSFGYFDDQADNLKVLQQVNAALESGGIFVLDFMNTSKVINTLKPTERIVREHITFEITRRLEANSIVKTISCSDQGEHFVFQERVQALFEKDFESMLTNANFALVKKAGDYQLNAFDREHSDRLILICTKP